MSSELLRLREVMDKLRSPGGCPWDAEQDHTTLLKYLLEESYEFIESVENDWDGTYTGLGKTGPLPASTYFYLIDTMKKSQDVFKGYLEVQP